MSATNYRPRELYDFAVDAGTLEGYVYPGDAEQPHLMAWIQGLFTAYQDVAEAEWPKVEDLFIVTLERTVEAIEPLLGEDNEIVQSLMRMMHGVDAAVA